MAPSGSSAQVSSRSGQKSREKWFFVGTALVMLTLCMALFAVVRLLIVFPQARTGAIESLLLQSAAIGVIVTASIQTVRAILPVRSRFHRVRVESWLGRAPDDSKELPDFTERMRKAVGYPDGVPPERVRAEDLKPLGPYVMPETTEQQILDELLRLTTAEGRNRPAVSLAFFDLPLEQLCGQISAGA